MQCPYCGAEIKDGSNVCSTCGKKIDQNTGLNASMNTTKSDGVVEERIKSNSNKTEKNDKVPFCFQMWFIFITFLFTMTFFGIPAIVLFIVRIIKYPNNRKGAWIGLGCSAGIFVGGFILLFAIILYSAGADDRAIDKLVDEGKYEEAIEYVESNFDSRSYSYYQKMDEIYQKQGDYDAAAMSMLKYVDISPDLTVLNDTTTSKLELYKGKVSEETEEIIDSKLNEIATAIAEKEEAERKAAEEKAAKEAAEREAAERKAAEEQAAREAAEKEAAEKKAAEEKAAREAAEKEAAEKKAAEQKAKEDAEKSIIQNAQILGSDLVMESHSSSYEDKYFKTEGTIEEVTDEGAYRIRYLSTVNNHKRMYKAWIIAEDTSGLYVGENVFVVAKYVGFAENSSAPTLEQYKIDKSADSFYSLLSKKAKVINKDISFDNLLRYGEYQEYVYVEGVVTQVYESCINIRDENNNYYVIFDNRVNPNVILQDDYVRIYGQFEGIDKDGYVWPLISWLVDGNQ